MNPCSTPGDRHGCPRHASAGPPRAAYGGAGGWTENLAAPRWRATRDEGSFRRAVAVARQAAGRMREPGRGVRGPGHRDRRRPGALSGRRVQFIVIGLVVLLSAAATTLALGPPVDSNAPSDHAFAARHGSEVTAATQASPAQLAATTRLPGVTAAAGPFPQTTVTATMLVPSPPGQSGPSLPNPQQMTVVGRASPGGPVDDLTLISGHWATQPGQAVLLTVGQASPVGIGTQMIVSGVPGSPRLTVVGTAVSITRTAQAWVAPAEIAALRAPGTPDVAQMLYRFSGAGTAAEVNADVAALRTALPHGALLGARSWLTVKLQAAGSISRWSWWQQAVFDSCILIGLAALTLAVIKYLLPRPERGGPGAARTWAVPHDQELGPVPPGTRGDASGLPAPDSGVAGPLLPVT